MEIDWFVSMATNLIAYADDAGSKRLGEVSFELLSQKWGATKSIRCVPYSKLDEVDFKTVTGVLVMTVVARDGGILREISRDLRAYMEAGMYPDVSWHRSAFRKAAEPGRSLRVS